METRKRLLTTLPSCHSCQFITVMFEEGGEMKENENRFAVSVFHLFFKVLFQQNTVKVTVKRQTYINNVPHYLPPSFTKPLWYNVL